MLTSAGGDRLRLGDTSASDDAGTTYLVIRWAPGVDHTATLDRLGDLGPGVALPTAPPEIRGLRDVELFPLVAAALVLLGVVATGHGVIVTVRNPRQASRDAG